MVSDERLYREALFGIFSQNERYSKIYKTDKIMIDFVNFLNSSHPDIDRLFSNYSYTTTQRKSNNVEKEVCSTILYILKFKNNFLKKHFKGILPKDIDKKNFKINFKEALQRYVYFQNIVPRPNDVPTNPFIKSQLQTNMDKRPPRKENSMAPAMQLFLIFSLTRVIFYL